MHITHVVINFIALKRARAKDCRPSADFRVVGDDNVMNDDTLYREYLNIQDKLFQPMSKEKNIVSDAQGAREVFCNFLKIISYGDNSFRAFNFTTLINFFKNPGSNIFQAFSELLKINPAYPISSMLKHTNYSKELINESNESYDVNETRLNLLDGLYTWMFADQELGGLGMSIMNIALSLGLNPSHLIGKYGNSTITNESMVYLWNRKITKHFQRLEDSLTRNINILYGFGHELSLLNKVIEKVAKAMQADPDFGDKELIDILTESKVDQSTLTSPVLIILSRMLLDQRQSIKTSKKEFLD
jgi:hypothetical protein